MSAKRLITPSKITNYIAEGLWVGTVVAMG
jgi:hypothetical protein